MRHIGFTGSQSGVTPEQLAALFSEFIRLGDFVLHHGDCIGADAAAHDAAALVGSQTVVLRTVYVELYPGTDANGQSPKRAWCGMHPGLERVIAHPAEPYMVRNKQIVHVAEILFARPDGPEKLRSGTWSTVRYALGHCRPVVIVWPDGSVERRG